MKKLILTFICLFLVIPCQAEIITVDDDAPNDPGPGNPQVSDPLEDGTQAHPFDAIQEAIDAAEWIDTVIVLDGTYTGTGNRDIDFGGKAITVRSQNGPQNCAIDCNGTGTEPHRGYYFHSNEDANSVVDGFTITNGHGFIEPEYSNWYLGGGIYCTGSGPTITNCIITGNKAIQGAGIFAWKNSSPTIINCTVNGNTRSGGIYCWRNTTATITDCIVSGNHGRGIYCWDSPSAEITNCEIINNTMAGVASHGEGSWVISNCTISDNRGPGIRALVQGTGTISNCMISGNADSFDGGGIWLAVYENGIVTITNCTITGNSAIDHFGHIGRGGGISCCSTGNTIITNSIVCNNIGGDIYLRNFAMPPNGDWTTEPTKLTVSYSCPGVIFVQEDPIFGDPILILGDGNIDAEPCFVQPGYWDANNTPVPPSPGPPPPGPPPCYWVDGDYHLLPDSLCINAGDPNYVAEPNETDLDGEPRVIGGRIDMGAYEFQSPRLFYVDDDAPNDPGPGDPCVSDPLENGTQAHPFDAIQEAIDAAHDADTVTVAEGTYTEIINFKGKNIILTSTAPNKSDIVKRTTIDGSVWFRGTEAASCKLTGFNIDGYIFGFDWEIDPYGKNHTHATISHCVLENIMTGCGRLIYGCDGTISNCVIANISYMCLSPWPTPAIVGCHGLFKNCTIANAADGIEILPGGTCTIENCIIYHWSAVIVYSGAMLNISYSDLQGGLEGIWGGGTVNWGPGNIDTDPCLARLGNWRLGNWQTEGDYHLKSQAGRWDANEGRWTKDEVTSPCIDAGDIYSPIGYEPFPNGGVINMGAYGGTAEASKSYFGKPLCETIVAGDINGDCEVNFKDFALMALHWLECIEPNQGRWHLVEDDTEDSYSCEGNFDVSYPCSNAVDEDWDTYALPADGGATSYIYENYIMPTGITMAEFTIKYRQTAAVTPGLCTNVTDYWDGSTWKELDCTALTNQTSTLTVEIPDDALSGTTLQLRTPTWKSLGIPGSGSGMYYEGKVIWYLLPVCQTIVAGDINSE